MELELPSDGQSITRPEPTGADDDHEAVATAASPAKADSTVEADSSDGDDCEGASQQSPSGGEDKSSDNQEEANSSDGDDCEGPSQQSPVGSRTSPQTTKRTRPITHQMAKKRPRMKKKKKMKTAPPPPILAQFSF